MKKFIHSKINLFSVLAFAFFNLLVIQSKGQTVLAQWDFPSNPDNATCDAGIAANSAKTISTVGGTSAVDFAAAGSATQAANATIWTTGSGTKYWLIDVVTTGYSSITVSSAQRSSNTGPRDFRLEYNTGSGWNVATGGTIIVAANFTSGVLTNVALPAACDNQASLQLRWIMTTNEDAQASVGNVVNGGASRIDDIIIKGTVVATPMSFVSCTTTQSNTASVAPGATNQELIGVQVVTTGSTSPLTASSFSFNTTGSTSAVGDITNATLWTTGTSGTFATTTQLGAVTVGPNGAFTVTGGTNLPYTLASGTNYFWITYTITAGATPGNVVDATCSSVTVGGTPRTPTVQTPPGNRPIAVAYCIPAPTSVDGTGITNVTCGTINNTTGAEATNYGNYSAQTATFMQGDLVTVNITYSTGYDYLTKIWVDWNNDGDFADSGEEVYSGLSLSTNPTTLVATFNVPVGASVGNHRMRIGGCDSSTPIPCYTGTYGTYEDYSLNITALPACAGSPTPGTATASVTTATCSTNSTLTLAGYTTGVSGISLQWQSAPAAGGPWTDISGATSATYAATSVSVTTYYRCVVTCSNGGGTANSTVASVTISSVVGGTTVSSANPVCSGITFTLSLSGSTTTGVTYQWQSSPDNATWTNIGGATSVTLATSQTGAIYYHCNITCTASATTVASSSLQVTMNAPTACYCANTGGSASYYINSFSTTGGTTNISNTTGALSAGGYGNFTAQAASSMQTTTVNFSITTGSSAFSTYGFGIWIDWNQDGDFADAGEEVYNSAAYLNSTTGSFTVPITALPGSTRMRVVTDYNATSPVACPGASNTECEDYTFTVIALPACAGSPTPGTATASVTTATCSSNSTLTLAGYTTGVSGILFQWQSAPAAGGPWANIGGATSATYAATNVAVTTYFRCVVTCSNGGGTANSTVASVTISPVVGGTTVSSANPVCSGVNFTLSLTGNTTTGVTYQWQSSPDNASWTNIGGATSATLATSQIVATYYRCNITCTASATTVASSSLQETMSSFLNCYCSSAATSTGDMDITKVIFGTINNISTCSSLTGTQGVATGTASLYSNFTATVPIPSVTQGTSVASTVIINDCGNGTWSHEVHIYIDFNHNGILNDAGEDFTIYPYTSSATHTIAYSIPIPMSALTGTTLMRVVCRESSTSGPCLVSSYGETEDYLISIAAAPPCSGAPTPGTATTSIATFCNSGTPILATTGYTTGVTGISFQWYISASNSPYAWGQIPGATSATYTSPSISQTSYYYCEVNCGASSASTNIVSVTNNASIITSTNNPVSVACGAAASLTATASAGTINWYANATGGSSVATGSPYAPVVSANTTYYATASSGGSSCNVGKPSWTAGDGYFGTTNWGIRFNALSAFTLVSVKVYVQTAGNTVKIQLQDNTGANVGAPVTTTGTVAGLNTITLNMSIPIGNDYRLVSANTTNLGRGGTGVAFPYTCPGVCTITASEWGGTTTGTYYFFYDWVVSTACESSPRTPVNVTVSGATAPVCSAYSTPTNGAVSVCPVSTSINWLASNTSCRTATSYLLYFGTDAAATNISNGVNIGNVLTYNLGTLSASTTYYWKIVPTNSGGNAVGCTVQSFSTAANPGSICPGLLGTGVISVASLPYASGAGTTAGSVNDLTSANTTTCGSNSYLTGEDQVFYFTPSVSGTITINLTSTGTYTGLMLYDGCPLSAASCGASPGNCVGSSTGYDGNKTLNACVTAGVTYYLILDSYASPSSNSYSNLTISAVTPYVAATNDLPCNATPLSLGVTVNGNNSCTFNISEPNTPSCWTSGVGNTVWYTVVAPASGQLSVRTMLGSLLNTQIALYSGACGSLNQVAPTSSSCNDNMTGCGSSEASQMNLTGLTPGATYYIVVDGAYDQTGTFTIAAIDPSTQSFPSTPGQDCSIAFPTCNSILSVSDPGYANTGSSCDFTGANDCTSGERASVWYNIAIGANGTLTFDIIPNDYSGGSAGSETDYDFLVWKTGGAGATTCAGMQTNSATGLVACNFSYLGVTGVAAGGTSPIDPSFDGAYETSIPVLAGEQYTIVIQNYTGSTSGFTIDYTSSSAGAINYAPSSSILNWTGSSSNAWASSANWGGCAIPACGTSAVVGALVPRFPIISANQSVNDLTIDAGATLTINAGVTLTVCGNFVNNGTLVMAPTATLFFNNTATHTISGNLTGTNSLGNLLVTQTAGSVTFLSDIDVAGNMTTSNATSIINSNNKYVKLKGNFVNAAGNTTYTNPGTTGTLEFNGTAAQTYTQGSSQLDLNFVKMNHTSTGVTLLSNMFIKSVTGSLDLTLGKIITNAFEVNVANTATTSVTTGNTSSFVQGNLRRYILSTGSYDFPVGDAVKVFQRANINFTAATTIGNLLARFDPWPGSAGYPPVQGGTECSTTYSAVAEDNGYWTITANATPTSGTFTTTLYPTNATNTAIASAWTVMKQPTIATTGWLLNGTCAASTAALVVRTAMNGFSVFGVAQAPANLPVELLSFTGTNYINYNLLDWKTLTEINNDYFVVESSSNSDQFIDIGHVKGGGNSNTELSYNFVDRNPNAEITYYRLKQVDFDGSLKYSNTISIRKSILGEVNFYPNPAKDKLYIDINSTTENLFTVKYINVLGSVVKEEINVVEGNKQYQLREFKQLSKGMYFIQLLNENDEIIKNQKIVKD